MDKGLFYFIDPEEFVVGYSKAPEQPQSSTRPICHSYAMTSTGRKPATIRIAAYRSLPHYALRHGRRHTTHTVFPRLDALHVLDASAHFDAGWSGRNTFQTPSQFNVQIDACAPFDAGHATHNLLIDAQVSNRGNRLYVSSYNQVIVLISCRSRSIDNK